MNGRWILEQINKRLRGEMSDSDWSAFQAMVDTATRSKLKCALCKDQGYVFTKNRDQAEIVYRCNCPAGAALPDTFFAPSDKDKTKPMTLRTYVKDAPPKKEWDRQKGEWD